jgi:TonB family protein
MACRSGLVVGALLAALLVLLEGAASAQQPGRVEPAPTVAAPPAPPPVVITPPVLTHDDGAEYPAGAVKDGVREPVKVVVVVDVDVTGAVTRTVLEAPMGHGFDEAALSAAQKLVFEPAQRNGKPVAARIKHTYEFAPPSSRLVGRVRSATNAPVGDAEITLRAADGTEQKTRSTADGRWTFPTLKTGTYRVTVHAAGFDDQTAEQDVAPGEEVSNVVRLNPVGPGATPPGVKPPAPDEEVDEVTVKGTRPAREVTRRTLERREMDRIPGTNGDALRSLQNLPGVARPPGFAGLLLVRGSAPQDTNVFVDGTLIPLVYHFGGLSSVVPTELLEKIDFYPGNFSAQYGRVMGGIVDVGIRDPKKDKLHGLAQVDLIDARVMAEGPLGKGWSFAVAGRRSYVDVWLKPVLESTGAGVTTAPVYYDYQAILQKDFDKNSSFRLMFYGADDRIDILVKSVSASDPSFGGGISAHTGFWRAQARYKIKISKDTEFKLTSAIGQDFVDFSLGDNLFTLTSYPITTRAEISQKVATGVTLNLGMDMFYAPYDVHVRFPPLPRPGEPPSGPFLGRPALESKDSDALYRPALYTEFELTPWRGARIVPGVRLDYAKDTQEWDFGPRVNARQDLTRGFPRTTLKGGVGIFSQPPQPFETNRVFGMPGLVSNRAYHYATGVEQEITKNIEISVEGYYKQLDRLVTQGYGNVGRGRTYGIETLLRYKPDARFFGWIAYTLSESRRQDRPEEPERLTPFSQTHILTVLGSYRLGHGWELGGRFRLVSGSLFTPSTYGFYDENAGASLPFRDFPVNGERFPMFHQLDLRVDKLWKFRAWELRAYLDVQNVYNHGNVEGVSYNYNSTRRTYASGLPLLPSIGLRAEF